MQQQAQLKEQNPQQFSSKAALKTPSAYFEYESTLEMQRTIGNHGLLRRQELTIQPKLKISEPSDIYEQEADRVVGEVMRMPQPKAQRRISEVRNGVGISPVQAKTSASPCTTVAPDTGVRIDALHGLGQPLDAETRAFFEPRFGYDLGQVKIHHDAHANQLANSVNALAFTVGHDVVFGPGQYEPGTSDRYYLLAHELVHSIQQAHNPSSKLSQEVLIQRFTDFNYGVLPGDWEGGGPTWGPRKRPTSPPEKVQKWTQEDDQTIKALLAQAMAHTHGDVALAFKYARDLRQKKENFYDMNLAIASDYLRARYDIIRGRTYTEEVVRIETYMWLKKLGLVPPEGPGPVSPYNKTQHDWMIKGARDQSDEKGVGEDLAHTVRFIGGRMHD